MVKMNGCAAIDSVRPFRFLADKAAVAADFHLGNGACYYEEQRIASTASVATLAKTGVVRPGFPCRTASKSSEYPHRSLPFRHAMHGGNHFSLPANCETHLASNARVYTPVQSCWGNAPQLLNDFREIGYAPAELNINLSSESESGIFRLMAFRHIRFFLISVDRHLAKVSAHILYPKLRHPRLYQAEFSFIYEKFDLCRSLAICFIRHRCLSHS